MSYLTVQLVPTALWEEALVASLKNIWHSNRSFSRFWSSGHFHGNCCWSSQSWLCCPNTCWTCQSSNYCFFPIHMERIFLPDMATMSSLSARSPSAASVSGLNPPKNSVGQDFSWSPVFGEWTNLFHLRGKGVNWCREYWPLSRSYANAMTPFFLFLKNLILCRSLWCDGEEDPLCLHSSPPVQLGSWK